MRIEPLPGPDVLDEGLEPDLLGLFQGDARGEEPGAGPPQILLYTANLWDYAGGDTSTYREEVRVTFLHELGHYLGWEEDDLASRGLE